MGPYNGKEDNKSRVRLYHMKWREGLFSLGSFPVLTWMTSSFAAGITRIWGGFRGHSDFRDSDATVCYSCLTSRFVMCSSRCWEYNITILYLLFTPATITSTSKQCFHNGVNSMILLCQGGPTDPGLGSDLALFHLGTTIYCSLVWISLSLALRGICSAGVPSYKMLMT